MSNVTLTVIYMAVNIFVFVYFCFYFDFSVTWQNHYPIRDLKALSAHPLLMNPTHYTGMDGYISDTEDSHIMDSDKNIINNT